MKLRRIMNEKAISIFHDNQIADLYPDFVFKERQVEIEIDKVVYIFSL